MSGLGFGEAGQGGHRRVERGLGRRPISPCAGGAGRGGAAPLPRLGRRRAARAARPARGRVALAEEEGQSGDGRRGPRRVEAAGLRVDGGGLRELPAALEDAPDGEFHERVLRLQEGPLLDGGDRFARLVERDPWRGRRGRARPGPRRSAGRPAWPRALPRGRRRPSLGRREPGPARSGRTRNGVAARRRAGRPPRPLRQARRESASPRATCAAAEVGRRLHRPLGRVAGGGTPRRACARASAARLSAPASASTACWARDSASRGGAGAQRKGRIGRPGPAPSRRRARRRPARRPWRARCRPRRACPAAS